MKKQHFFALLATITLAVIAVLAVNRFSDGKSARPIQITAIVPLSGNFAKVGEPKKNGITLAINEINQRGGVNGRLLTIEFIDSKGSSTDGLNAFQQSLTTKRADAYYIDMTPIAGACIPVANERKAVTFFGTAHPTLVSTSPWAFRVFASGAQEAKVLVESLTKLKVTKVFVLRVGDSYGQGLFEAFDHSAKMSGIKILGCETFENGQQDVKGLIEKAKSANPERVVMMDYGVTLPTLLSAAREGGIPSTAIFCNLGFVGTPAPSKLPPETINGIVFVAPAFALDIQTKTNAPGTGTFRNDYEKSYGSTPGHTAAYAYDAILAITEGMRRAKSTEPEALRKALSDLPEFQGASGKVALLPDGDCITEMTLANVVDGKLVPINP